MDEWIELNQHLCTHMLPVCLLVCVHRWRAQRMTEDYVNLVGDMMYPKVGFGAYGYDTEKVRPPPPQTRPIAEEHTLRQTVTIQTKRTPQHHNRARSPWSGQTPWACSCAPCGGRRSSSAGARTRSRASRAPSRWSARIFTRSPRCGAFCFACLLDSWGPPSSTN